MKNNKKINSLIMTLMFTSFTLLNGLEANAAAQRLSPQAQVKLATKYVVAAEKYVKPAVFTVKWAQQSVYSAQKQIKLINSHGSRTLLTKRLHLVQIKINNRAKIVAAISKAAIANTNLLKAVTTKVRSLETAATKDLTVQGNLVGAETLLAPITGDVSKLASGASKTSLVNRVKAATTKITNARTAFSAKAKQAHDTALQLGVIIQAEQTLLDGATEGTVDGNYTAGSKDTLKSAIAAAMSVVSNTAATPEAVTAAIAMLNTADSTFKGARISTHDTTDLSALIASAQALLTNATEGTADGNYAEGSKATLQSAITTAEAVVSNIPAASQTAIHTAFSDLNASISVFKNGLVATHDTTDLTAAINSAQTLLDSATEGTADGNYAVGSMDALQSAVVTAGDVVSDAAEIPQMDINTAAANLNNAISVFKNGLVATHDTTDLSAAIDAAQTLLTNATEGTSDGSYAEGSMAILQSAVTTAEAVVSTAATTAQTAIHTAASDLNKAISVFNNGLIVTHDTTDLSTAIASAQALLTNATEGTVDGNYAEGSKDILQSAVTAAAAVVSNAAVTSQIDINTAVSDLNDAITVFTSGLVATHDTTDLSSAIDTALTLLANATEGTADGNYADGSKAVLQSALETAESVASNALATSQTDINTAASDLNAAISIFNSGLVATHDTTDLSAAIASAQALLANATEGTSSGNYAVGSKAELQSAITAAEAVVTNAAETSQVSIDHALSLLNQAITTFQNTQVL